MGESVADDEIVYTEDDVIAEYLIEDFAGDGDIGCLVLDNHAGRQGGIIEDGVAAAGTSVEGDGYLISKKSGGIAEMGCKIVDKMLADPLLGSQGYVFATKDIEDVFPAVALGNFKCG